MATQEPNVYAGLSVVVGGLMHARPRFFAKVMGELLFWVGEDKMLFGSRLRDLGAEVADRGPRRLGLSGRHVLGLPALDDRRQEEGARPERRAPVRRRRSGGAAAARRARARPQRRTTRSSWRARRDHRRRGCSRRSPPSTTPSSTSRSPRWGSSARASCPTAATSTCTCACRPRSARRTSRSSWHPTRARPCAGWPGSARSASCSTTTTRRARSTPRSARGGGFAAAFPGESDRRPRGAARAVPAQGAARPPGPRLRDAARRRPRPTTRRSSALRVARPARPGPRSRAASRCARELGLPYEPDDPGARRRRRQRRSPPQNLPMWLRRARLVGLSLESNGGICRSLLRVRHGVPDPTEEVAT